MRFNFLACILNLEHVSNRVSAVLACARTETIKSRGKASTITANEEEHGLETLKILKIITLFNLRPLVISAFCCYV